MGQRHNRASRLAVPEATEPHPRPAAPARLPVEKRDAQGGPGGLWVHTRGDQLSANRVRACAEAIGAMNSTPGWAGRQHRRAAMKSGPRRLTSPARLPGSSATTVDSAASPAPGGPPRDRRRAGSDRPAGGRRIAPLPHDERKTAARRAAGKAPDRRRPRSFCTRRSRQAQTCGLTYWTVFRPRARSCPASPG